MTPPRMPSHESEDILDMTPYAPDDAPDSASEEAPDAPPPYEPYQPYAPESAPSGSPEDGLAMAASQGNGHAPEHTPAQPPAHAPAGPRENRPNAILGHWKLFLLALGGLVAVVLAVRVLGVGLPSGPSGSPSPAPTATSAPAQIGDTPITTTNGPLILLNPGVVRQGAAVSVMGSGFDPGAIIDLTIKRQESGKALASTFVKADKGGFFGDAELAVPMSLSSGNFIVEAHQRNSKYTTRATGTVAGGAPQVKLGTMVGKPGDIVVISLNGFAPEEQVNVYWNTLSGDPVTHFQADGGGAIGQAKLRVPFGALGNNTFLFVGAKSQSLVAANFLVLKMYPTIKLTSYALRADSVMSFSGSGFGPNERVLVFLNSPNSAPLAVVSTDATGSFKNGAGFVVPFALKGKQTLIFMGEQSRAPNTVAFTVMPYAPLVQPSTYGGFPGTTITFFATGFARNEVVHIYAGHTKGAMGTMVSCFQADGKGNAAGVGSYLIPGTAQGALGFALVGVKSEGVGVASVNVTAPPMPVQTPPQPPFTCPLDPPPAQQPPANGGAPQPPANGGGAPQPPADGGPQAHAAQPEQRVASRPVAYFAAYAPTATVGAGAPAPAARDGGAALGSDAFGRGARALPSQLRASALMLGLELATFVAALALIRRGSRRQARCRADGKRGHAPPACSKAALAGAIAVRRGAEGSLAPPPGAVRREGGLAETRVRLATPQALRRRSRFARDRGAPPPSRAALGPPRRASPRAWRIAGHALEFAALIAALALTRFLATQVWRLPIGDVGLYREYAVRFWTRPPVLHALPVEYPPLAILPFSLTLLPPGGDYTMVYALWMGLLVIVGYLGFLRYSTRRRAVVYIAYLLIGTTATLLARFDIVPALLTLAALWATQRRRFVPAYLLIAAGTLLKLYPIFLLPVVLIADVRAATMEAMETNRTSLDGGTWGREHRAWWRGGPWAVARRIGAGSAAMRAARGAALCLGVMGLGFACALALSPGGALSSFAYAGKRPLQVESMPATLLWLGTLVGIPAGPDYSFSSLNYVGQLDGVLKPLSSLAPLAACGVVYARQARGRLTAGQAFLACLCVVLATYKIFSPQYLMWVLPLVAAVEGFSFWWLAICVLTTIDYPILYLTRSTFATVPYTPAFMPVLAARNLLLCAITIRAMLRRPRLAAGPAAASAGVPPWRSEAAASAQVVIADASHVSEAPRSGR